MARLIWKSLGSLGVPERMGESGGGPHPDTPVSVTGDGGSGRVRSAGGVGRESTRAFLEALEEMEEP